jgi:hypothetical protein
LDLTLRQIGFGVDYNLAPDLSFARASGREFPAVPPWHQSLASVPSGLPACAIIILVQNKIAPALLNSANGALLSCAWSLVPEILNGVASVEKACNTP